MDVRLIREHEGADHQASFSAYDRVEVELPHGYRAEIRDMGPDIAIILHAPGDQHGTILDSVMKAEVVT